MDQHNHDLLYPPPSNGNIFWMYPWQSFPRDIGELILNLATKTVIGKYITNEKQVKHKLDSYFPTQSTVYTDGGRSAILLSLKALGITYGDEVILSTFNCSSVIDPIISTQATPVLVDCDENGKIDTNEINKAITNKTKAIILTNIYGVLDNKELIRKLISNKSITIIDDLSQSLIIPGLNPNYFNKDEIYIFSFGPEKQLCCFGGGAVFCLNSTISKIKKIHEHSITTSDSSLLAIGMRRIQYYFTLAIYGYSKPFATLLRKMNLLTNFSARKSLSKPSLPESITIKSFSTIQMNILLRKLKDYKIYADGNLSNQRELLSKASSNKTIRFITGNSLNPSYVTVVIDGQRFEISKRLSLQKVPTVWNYIPLHMLQRYKKYMRHQYTIADHIWKNVLSLPFRYPMSKSQISKVAEALQYATKN